LSDGIKDNKSQLLYIAGLFDGEGSTGVYAPGQLSMCVQMTSTLGVEYIRSLFGGHIHEYTPRKPNCHTLYDIQYSGLKAEKVLRTVLPFLLVKREQVNLVLEYWEKLKVTPRWYRLNLIKEYRQKLAVVSPHSANVSRRGRLGHRDLKPRKKRGAKIVNTSSFVF
jgi:hypothetical protein